MHPNEPESRPTAARHTWQQLAVPVGLGLVLLMLSWIAWLAMADAMAV
jgi:hypothetical protein